MRRRVPGPELLQLSGISAATEAPAVSRALDNPPRLDAGGVAASSANANANANAKRIQDMAPEDAVKWAHERPVMIYG